MTTLITLTTAEDVSLTGLLTAVNQAYEDYFVPVSLTEKAFKSLLARESVVLDQSPIALVDGEVVGVVLLAKRGERGWIGGVGVIQAYRRQNIARRLLEEAITRARSLGIQTLQLEVIIENENAIQLYEKLGFTTTRDLFVMSCDGVGGTGISQRSANIKPFRPGRRSPSLDWVAESTPIPLPWQREREALKTERFSLRGTALLDDNSEELTGICLYQDGLSDIDLKVLIAADVAAGETLLGHLLSKHPWTFTSCLNVPEDDPMISAYRNLGFKIVLIQHEMHLQIG